MQIWSCQEYHIKREHRSGHFPVGLLCTCSVALPFPHPFNFSCWKLIPCVSADRVQSSFSTWLIWIYFYFSEKQSFPNSLSGKMFSSNLKLLQNPYCQASEMKTIISSSCNVEPLQILLMTECKCFLAFFLPSWLFLNRPVIWNTRRYTQLKPEICF